MSYNPTAWHTRRIEDLWLDIDVLRENGFKIQVELSSDGTIGFPKVVPTGENYSLVIELDEADMKGGSVLVSKFDWENEMYRDDYESIQRILSFSVGLIEYVIVWENGDSVQIVTYKDGIEEVEIIV